MRGSFQISFELPSLLLLETRKLLAPTCFLSDHPLRHQCLLMTFISQPYV